MKGAVRLGVAKTAAERELVHAEQVESDHKEQDGEQRHHPRRLQLEAPSERAAGLLQGDQQPRQQHERKNHAHGECDTVRSHRSAVRTVLSQADEFQ
jgi:hypothetical protein